MPPGGAELALPGDSGTEWFAVTGVQERHGSVLITVWVPGVDEFVTLDPVLRSQPVAYRPA